MKYLIKGLKTPNQGPKELLIQASSRPWAKPAPEEEENRATSRDWIPSSLGCDPRFWPTPLLVLATESPPPLPPPHPFPRSVFSPSRSLFRLGFLVLGLLIGAPLVSDSLGFDGRSLASEEPGFSSPLFSGGRVPPVARFADLRGISVSFLMPLISVMLDDFLSFFLSLFFF